MGLLILWMGVFVMGNEDWKDLQEFRLNAEASLKKNWLVVVGLDWLKDGEVIVGSASDAKIKLPSRAPERLAKLDVKKNKVTMTLLEDKGVFVDGLPGQKGQTFVLQNDSSPQKTVVRWGSLEMYLIDRAKGQALRIKDSESEALKSFEGLLWWEPKKEYVVQGKWKPLATPKIVKIPDVTGGLTSERMEGSVVFELQGKTQELFPTREGDSLFFVFRDLSSGKTSYGPGRFLNAEVRKDGTVAMDFNRATNPPCAFISFATCPLPPPENVMKVSIEAGAKSPRKKTH